MEQNKFLEAGFDFSTASDAELSQFARENEAFFTACTQVLQEMKKREDKYKRSMRAKMAAQARKAKAAQGA